MHEGLNIFRNDTDIYAQRVDSSGNILWPEDSITVCSNDGYEHRLQIIDDGSGGAIIAWIDCSKVFIQRIDNSGSIMWDTNGIDMGGVRDTLQKLQIVSDESGGAIIVAEEGSYESAVIFKQTVDHLGSFTRPDIAVYPKDLVRGTYEPETLLDFVFDFKYEPIYKLKIIGFVVGVIAISIFIVIFIIRVLMRRIKE
ncbi:hypothetical protein ACFLXD_05025 [Chloroflexota bacterium]